MADVIEAVGPTVLSNFHSCQYPDTDYISAWPVFVYLDRVPIEFGPIGHYSVMYKGGAKQTTSATTVRPVGKTGAVSSASLAANKENAKNTTKEDISVRA